MNTNRLCCRRFNPGSILLMLMCLLVGKTAMALPEDFNITQITHTTENEYSPRMNSIGQVTWYRHDGNDNEIYLWDGSSIIQITNNTTDDTQPEINDAGQLTWRNYTYATTISEIYFWDGAGPVHISTTSSSNFSPKINSAGQVTWYGSDGTESEIYLWDGSSVTQITDNTYLDQNPEINAAGQLAWYAREDVTADYEIFFWDGTNIIQVTNNSEHDSSPLINASGQLAWNGDDGTDTEIFFWDGTTITQVTDNDYDDRVAAINTNGWIAGSTIYPCVITPCFSEDHYIYYWDGASINYIYYTSAYTGSGSFSLDMNDSGTMVWFSLPYSNVGEDIYVWDGSSVFSLTSNLSSDWDPDLNNIGQIAWVGIPDGESDLEVLLATPINPPTGPLIAHYPFNGNANDISGYSLHGSIIGGAGFTTGADGSLNSAIALDGINDYVQLPHEWAFDLDEITIAATVQLTDINDNILVSKGPSYGNFTLMFNNWFHPAWPGFAVYGQDTWYGVATNAPAPMFEYFRIAVTSAGGELRTYINGAPEKNLPFPIPLQNDLPVTIGAAPYSGLFSDYFSGMIDDLRIYNVALTDTEVRDLHDAPPVSDAGADQTVTIGSIVSLDGSASYDPDGHVPLSYSWSILSAPAGSSATLSDPNDVAPTFIADQTGTYIVQLLVTDNLGLAGLSDSVTITADPPPLAITGIWPASAAVGENVSVFIFGSAFTTDNTTDVYFNGVQQLFVAPVSEEMLIVRLSPVTADLFGPVTVTTPYDSTTSSIDFGTPQTGLSITGIWPSTAPIGTYSSIFVFGTGFTLDNSTEVYFNGIRQWTVAPVSEEMLIVRVLGDASLTGPVQVTTPAGSVISTDILTFIP